MTSRRRKDAASPRSKGAQGQRRGSGSGQAPGPRPAVVPQPRTDPGADAAPTVPSVTGDAVAETPWGPGDLTAGAGQPGSPAHVPAVPPAAPAPQEAASPGVPDWVRALTTARLSAGASLEQVSARTRVRPGVLRDLEAGRLTSSGGTVYARGHLRSVAQALGVDPTVLLAPFDAAVGAPAPVLDPPHLGVERVGGLRVPLPSSERSGPRWGAALVAALVVLAVLLVVGTLRSGSRAPTVADPLPSPAPVAATSRASAAAPAVRRPAVRPVAGARLRLRVLSGSSWVRVTGPGGTVFEGVLAQGQAPRDFADARSLTVLAGNAGALGVACSGHDLAPAGSTGVVRRFTCGPQGLAPA